MAETGHARNVERFAQMLSFVQGYGAGIDGVTSALAPWKVVVNDRQNVFEGIRKLTTRVVNIVLTRREHRRMRLTTRKPLRERSTARGDDASR